MSKVILCFMLVCLCLPGFTSAQTLQSYTTYDGWLSFEFPAGWEVWSEPDADGSGFFVIASSADALDAVQADNDLSENIVVPPAEVVILVVRDLLGDSPEAVLASLPGDTEDITIRDYRGKIIESADASSAGATVVLQMPGGEMIMLAISTATQSDYEAQRDTIFAVLESIQYGGGAQVISVPEPILLIGGVRWSPDSQHYTIATGTDVFHTTLYDAAANTPLYETAGFGVRWTQDSTRVLIYGEGDQAVVVDAQTGTALFSLPTTAGSARWSPDESLIVTGDLETALQIWDAETGALRHTLPPAQSWEFNADQTRLALWDYDGRTVQVWDVVTGQQVFEADRARRFFSVSTFEQLLEVFWMENSLFIIQPDETPAVLDGSTGDVLATIPPPDGMKLDKAAWHPGRGLALEYSTSGCRTNACDGMVIIVDGASGAETLRLSQPGGIVGDVEWSPDGTRIATSVSFEPNRVLMWDAATGNPLWETPLNEKELYVDIVWVNNERLYVDMEAHTAPLLDATTGEIVAANTRRAEIGALVFNTERSQALIPAASIAQVQDTQTGEIQFALPHDADMTEAAWVMGEAFIYTITESGRFTLWDAQTGERLVEIREQEQRFSNNNSQLELSPDATALISHIEQATRARRWDMTTLIAAGREALQNSPFTAEEYLEQATAARQTGDYPTAIAALEQVIALDPDNVAAYVDLGRSYYNSDQFDQAVVALNQAIDLRYDHMSAWLVLGNIHRLSGDMPKARQIFETALGVAAADEDRAAFYNLLGITYLDAPNNPQYATAVEHFTQAITLNPNLTTAYFNRGYAYYWQGAAFYEQAAADWEVYAQMAGADADPATLERLQEIRGN